MQSKKFEELRLIKFLSTSRQIADFLEKLDFYYRNIFLGIVFSNDPFMLQNLTHIESLLRINN